MNTIFFNVAKSLFNLHLTVCEHNFLAGIILKEVLVNIHRCQCGNGY